MFKFLFFTLASDFGSFFFYFEQLRTNLDQLLFMFTLPLSQRSIAIFWHPNNGRAFYLHVSFTSSVCLRCTKVATRKNKVCSFLFIVAWYFSFQIFVESLLMSFKKQAHWFLYNWNFQLGKVSWRKRKKRRRRWIFHKSDRTFAVWDLNNLCALHWANVVYAQSLKSGIHWYNKTDTIDGLPLHAFVNKIFGDYIQWRIFFSISAGQYERKTFDFIENECHECIQGSVVLRLYYYDRHESPREANEYPGK